MRNDEEQICREFDQLIGRHRKLIEFLCVKASYGQDIYYLDLMQECYVALLEHLSERESGMSELRERSWVFWQCRAAIARYCRGVKRFPKLLRDDMLADAGVATHEVTQLTIDDLAACLDGTERRFFLLLAAGASNEELEQKLGLKHQSVIQMHHNVKKKLQQYKK